MLLALTVKGRALAVQVLFLFCGTSCFSGWEEWMKSQNRLRMGLE